VVWDFWVLVRDWAVCGGWVSVFFVVVERSWQGGHRHSLRDGVLTIAGERQSSLAKVRTRNAPSVSAANSVAASLCQAGLTRQSQRLLQGRHPDGHSSEGGRSKAKESRSQHRIINAGGIILPAPNQEKEFYDQQLSP
jgi:hypothetical protein